MRLEKTVVRGGNRTTFPSVGDLVKVRYTLWLYDESRADKKGRELDNSQAPGVFTTAIGVSKVVKGWDILVPQMSLGETAILKIPSQLGYGATGYPGMIPPDADLIFEVELLQINNQKRS